ncbi:hypothetical protein BOO93_20055 [Vibrio navarrensis]|nr:hypothetical protein [Vibrio navarrensis]
MAMSLAGCPAYVDVEVNNNSDASIYAVYSSGYEFEIKAGETDSLRYGLDCISIKYKNEILEYTPITPPNDFYDKGVFSTSLYATFYSDKSLFIHQNAEISADRIELASNCNIE